MNPSEVYKIFGPLSIVATGLAIALMINKWRGDKSISISHNAAASKSSYLVMLVVQSVTLPMLFLFWSGWLAPVLELPTLFTVFAGLTCLGLLVAAWIPATKGWKDKAHNLFAYGAGTFVIPMLIIMCFSPHISSIAKYITLLVLLYEIVVATLFAFFKRGQAVRLYLQAGYIFLFAFATVAAAYI